MFAIIIISIRLLSKKKALAFSTKIWNGLEDFFEHFHPGEE